MLLFLKILWMIFIFSFKLEKKESLLRMNLSEREENGEDLFFGESLENLFEEGKSRLDWNEYEIIGRFFNA